MAIPEKAQKRYEKLRSEIEYHNHRYYVLDTPEISDEAYDSLLKEVKELERKYPGLITSASPTRQVGGVAGEAFAKVVHHTRQYSFDNIFSFKELQDWEMRMKRQLAKEGMQNPTLSYCAELKIDGLKAVLTYKKGKLVMGATRGNGIIGEDITHTIRTIASIPHILSKPVDIVAIGEIWLPGSELVRINKERKALGEPEFANTRNAAAGSVRQLDPAVASSRKLESFVYDIDYAGGIPRPQTQTEELELLKELGFQVNPRNKLCKTLEEIESYYADALTGRDKESYNIDGVVLKVNEVEFQNKLGHTAKAPRYGIAYKFPAQQVTTVVEDIVLQVGRTGTLTPVAHLRPVHVGGAMVSRATLHNEDFIKVLDIRVGDTVVLQRAGDVIPEVVKVLTELRTGKEKPWVFPAHSSLCGGDGSVIRVPGQAAWKCRYGGSFIQQQRRFEHFVSKHAFDIEGFGKEQVKLFLEKGLISDFADIFTIKKGDLLSLPRYGERSVDNLMSAIQKARTVTLARLLAGLSIEGVGEETAIDIAEHFVTLEAIQIASQEELQTIEGVGPIVAASVYAWFHSLENKRLLVRLLKYVTVISPQIQKKQKQNTRLADKTFVLTGTLVTMSRDEAKEKIRQAGGKVVSTVSKNTDYLVAGENPGSKYDTANTLGIAILDEKEFLTLLNRVNRPTL